MRSILLLSPVLALSAVAAFVSGCTSANDDRAATSDNAVSSGDIAAAKAAVALLSGANAHCNACHTASKEDITRWGATMKSVEDSCLSPSLTLTNEQRLACLKDETGAFTPAKLGLYAAGARTAQFKGYFADDQAYQDFQDAVAMPMGTDVPALTDAQWASIKTWVLGGMPALDVAMSDPDLGPCTPSITPQLRQHMTTMATDGWAARLADAATPMYGCGEASGQQCLTSLTDITSTWTAPNANQTLRKLRDIPFRSHWWIRSSPDGRYTGFGLNNDAKLLDHTKSGNDAIIDVKASYDPQFFPNNEGFSFAGAGGGSGPIKVCTMSVIAGASATNPITLNEPGCTRIISSVYQTVGAALDNHLYLMSTGTHVNDDAESSGQGPRPGFDTNAQTILTPMVNDGNQFTPRANITLSLPFEGDQALSASDSLLLTRFGGATGHRGYHIRKLDITETPSGGATTYSATSDVIGTVCGNGAKPAMSYDERFIVTHQYVDTNDPASAGLPPKSSNIVLMDLLTGEVTRLTKMGDRQYAFAPHFRADGWIYFVVRDMNSPTETLVASDAALRRMAATPTIPVGGTTH